MISWIWVISVWEIAAICVILYVGMYLVANTLLGLHTKYVAENTPIFPPISVLIPVYNEPIDALSPVLEAWRNVDYPDFEVIFVDDSTVPMDSAEFKCIRRVNRIGYKGGALRNAMYFINSKSEWVAVFDADCVVSPDVLKRMATHFNIGVGAVQGYQKIGRNYHQNALTRFIAMAASLANLQLLGRRQYHGFVCTQGTVMAYRVQAVREIGGLAPYITVNEDLDTSFRLFKAGWDIEYDGNIIGDHISPERVRTFWRQLIRWTSSTVREYRRHLGSFLLSTNVSLKRKLDSLAFLTFWILSLMVAPTIFFIPLIGKLLFALSPWITVVAVAIPVILFSTAGLVERALHRIPEALLLYFLLLIPGYFVSWYAVMKGLFVDGTFTRTNKTIYENEEMSAHAAVAQESVD